MFVLEIDFSVWRVRTFYSETMNTPGPKNSPAAIFSSSVRPWLDSHSVLKLKDNGVGMDLETIRNAATFG
jgi:hypothetical protein